MLPNLHENLDKYGENSNGSGSQQKLHLFACAIKCPEERAEEMKRTIAELAARDLQPISIMEGVGFKQLLSYIHVEIGYRIPS